MDGTIDPTLPDSNKGARLEGKPRNRFFQFQSGWKLVGLNFAAIVVIVLFSLFMVYKRGIDILVRPLSDWLGQNQKWSWTLPTVLLIIVSFPPLLGNEAILLFVGFLYPPGIAFGIAFAGNILGEALNFAVFRYAARGYTRRRVEKSLRWAAATKVGNELGFKGVMIIRWSLIPSRIAHPIFAAMPSMSFWLHNLSVIMSLPKVVFLVVLGIPVDENDKRAKADIVGQILAIIILVLITIWATRWISRRLDVAMDDIEETRDKGETVGMSERSYSDHTENDAGHAVLPASPMQTLRRGTV